MIWKTIPNFPDYEASENGDIRSKEKIIKQKKFYPYTGWINVERKLKSKVLKKQLNPSGYYQVNVYKNKKSSTKIVHLLVADTFLGDRDKLQVNHKNGIKTDNNLNNLEVVTASENIEHAINRGLLKRINGKFAKAC